MTVLCMIIPSCLSKSCSLANPTKRRNVCEGDKPFAQRENKLACELKLLKSLALPLMTAFIALSPIVNPPVSVGQTIDVQKGASLFNRACIGCHYEGGNIIQPGATLFLKDLRRNGVDTEEEIYRVTYYGKGRMPGFGQNCTPRGQCTFGPRLQDDEIKLLAEFVKSQADQDWPKIENSGD
ncbi:cytochrome c6, chloroplastic [Solanum pennellii]|uniref:Cytochrome c-553 n=1 Tax=Solanum pennellii TaxID=28526 RepID=A0ABM1FZG7_SOLPN|nr:cytochrome c6, chloroplastic [Solanum pennellii]